MCNCVVGSCSPQILENKKELESLTEAEKEDRVREQSMMRAE